MKKKPYQEKPTSTEKMRDLLVQGASALGLILDDEKIRQLLVFQSLLMKWNAVYNLTAVYDAKSILTYHLLDSLSLVTSIHDAIELLDVGSGGGLPGIVLAIACPEVAISLIDTVHKKTAFLTQVKTELGLKNVMVLTGRVEKLNSEKKFDIIVSRAFASLPDFVEASEHVLKESGRFIAMKGVIPEDEIAGLKKNWQVKAVIPVKVPMLEAKRHLIVVKKRSVKGDS